MSQINICPPWRRVKVKMLLSAVLFCRERMRDEEVRECENARVRELMLCLGWFGSVDYLDCVDSLDSEGNMLDTGYGIRAIIHFTTYRLPLTFSRITHHASRITHHASSRITHHASRIYALAHFLFFRGFSLRQRLCAHRYCSGY